jgi:prepilin-type N-terminal cleavage/methylation domain-containing protein
MTLPFFHKTTRNKSPFTLIEMLIVLTLIASALGALSLQISKALKGERFERGVEQVIAKLTLAQELMLDFHTDVHLTLTQEKGGVVCTLKTDLRLPDHLERAINLYNKIEGIEQMCFDNRAKAIIALYYDGATGVTPQGTLTLVAPRKGESIILKGYPAQIRRGIDEQTKNCHADYPEEIFSAI